jgi:hypothetical protein
MESDAGRAALRETDCRQIFAVDLSVGLLIFRDVVPRSSVVPTRLFQLPEYGVACPSVDDGIRSGSAMHAQFSMVWIIGLWMPGRRSACPLREDR